MKIFNMGLESISFQNGSFYKDLTKIIEDARKDSAKALTKEIAEKTAKEISLCIAKHTNILTTVEFLSDYGNACIFPSFFTPESVLYSRGGQADCVKEYYNELSSVKKGSAVEGWVNPSTSKVGGEFAKLTHASYYEVDFIFNKKVFSAEGAAAIILHEVGHAFTFFQFVADTAMLNITLTQTYQELMNAKDDKDVKFIIERARKELELENTSDWSQEVGKGSDAASIVRVLASQAVLQRKGSDNRLYYTQDSSEELAEIFCVRHGGSRGLIEVSQFFHDEWDIKDLNFGILSSLAIGALSALAIPLTPVAAIPLIYSLGMFISGNMGAASMPEFTKFSQTIGKVRNQLVEQLKQSKLPKEAVKQVLDNIDYAVKTIKESDDQQVPAIVKFWDFFRLDKKNSKAWREYHDELEKLATNDLFIRAARLSLNA